MSFPVHPDQLSAAWLTEKLREAGILGPGNAVREFAAKSIGEGVGLLGLVVRVELAYDTDVDAGPPTVVIKFAHPVPANRAIALNARMYEREVTFFR